MKDHIYKVKSTLWKSLLIKDNELWLSQSNMSSIDSFEKATQKTGVLKSSKVVPLDSITDIKFNGSSEAVKVTYVNEKGQSKSPAFEFESEQTANSFGNYLGESLGLHKRETKEGQLKALALPAIYVLLAIAATLYGGSMEDPSELDTSSGSRRSRGLKSLFLMLHNAVGELGIIIIGSLISLFLIYRLYQRYKNPATDIHYGKRN